MTNTSSVRLEVLVEHKAMARLGGPPDACTPSIWKQADLVPEGEAISVRLDGSVVGRLSSEDAATFRAMMKQASREGETLSGVQAEIASARQAGELKLGISLYLPGDLKPEKTRSS